MKKLLSYLFTLINLFSVMTSHAIDFKHIGISDGLSQLSVMSIQQDKLGRMWFGTEEGLNLYDGKRIKVFKPRYKIDAHSVEGNDGMLGNANYPIIEDQKGNLYFCSDNALITFQLTSQEFRTLRVNNVSTVTTYLGHIWFACEDSIFQIQQDQIKFKFRLPYHVQINCLHFQKDKLWIGSNSGLYTFNKQKKFATVLPNTSILSFFEDSRQALWIASLNDGAYKIDSQQQLTHYLHKEGDANTLSHRAVRCFTEDHSGNIWIGTFNGLNRLEVSSGKFTLYTSERKHDLSHSSIFSLYTDRQGNIWIGTYYGGVNYFHPGANLFSYYSENELHYPFVGSITEDNEQNLWICTEGGGLTRFDRQAQTFQHFPICWQEEGKNIVHNNLKAICYDSASNRLFIGTHTGGLSSYSLKTKQFKHYYLQSPHYAQQLGTVVDHLALYKEQLIIQVRGGIYTLDLKTEKFAPLLQEERYTHFWVRTFTIDSKGYIWIAGHSQLTRINLQHPTDKKIFDAGKKGLGRFSITAIVEDKQHQLYVSTRGSGLCKYEAKADSFITYTQASNRLLSDYCYDIALSPRGTLIITGNRGITLFHPATNKSDFIGLGSNMPLSAINIGCKAYVCKNGEIFIGGVNGLISFREEATPNKQTQNHLYFSNLEVNNQEIYPNDKSGILSQTLPLVKSIDLNYNQNNINLNFASNNYLPSSQSGIYEYKLQGLDKEWTSTTQAHLSYTNLPAGDYRLVLKEKMPRKPHDILQETTLDIHIHPAIYHTLWAYCLYTLAALTLLISFIRFYYSRMKLKASLEFERAGKERIEELNRAKIHFFTTVSHEFRTPLTLILSQMELLLENSVLSPAVYNRLYKIYKNARSMKSLISELLTFQQQGAGAVVLQIKEFDLYPFLKEIYLSFTDYAENQQMKYEFNCPQQEMNCWGDAIQLKKVFYNLLGNAFKYTPKQKKIEMIVTEKENQFIIQFIDNGRGISASDQKKIFDLFYRVQENLEEKVHTTGSGIGLSLVKKIIELHHGEISLTSQLNYGSIFTVVLQKGKQHFADDTQINYVTEEEEEENKNKTLDELSTTELPEQALETSAHTILIIEDNEEMLQILQTLFMPIYHVVLARNGKEGLAFASEIQPDIILSDIMMPEMSGKELCRNIKNNLELCHIPVVLLTALDSDEDKLEGLAQRADDYISKPFHTKQLIVRCNNLVYNREQLQRKFSKQDNMSSAPILATNQIDQKFLQKIDDVIAAHLDQEDFDIIQLAQEVGISRSSLYAKFKALSGISPNEHLVNCRLKQAARMLKEHPEWQVAEISYRVGFCSPRYFSKCFKTLFQLAPIEYRKENSGI